MNESKCIRIEMEYDDGRLERAKGKDAEILARNIAESFAQMGVYGTLFYNPQMKTVREGRKNETA